MYVIRIYQDGNYSYLFNHRMKVYDINLARHFDQSRKAIAYFKKSEFTQLPWRIIQTQETQ